MLDEFIKKFSNDKEIYLRLKIRPNATRTEIKDISEDKTIRINIAKPPIRGKANQELIRFLAKEFAVHKENVKIISGAGERVKLIKINK